MLYALYCLLVHRGFLSSLDGVKNATFDRIPVNWALAYRLTCEVILTTPKSMLRLEKSGNAFSHAYITLEGIDMSPGEMHRL